MTKQTPNKHRVAIVISTPNGRDNSLNEAIHRELAGAAEGVAFDFFLPGGVNDQVQVKELHDSLVKQNKNARIATHYTAPSDNVGMLLLEWIGGILYNANDNDSPSFLIVSDIDLSSISTMLKLFSHRHPVTLIEKDHHDSAKRIVQHLHLSDSAPPTEELKDLKIVEHVACDATKEVYAKKDVETSSPADTNADGDKDVKPNKKNKKHQKNTKSDDSVVVATADIKEVQAEKVPETESPDEPNSDRDKKDVKPNKNKRKHKKKNKNADSVVVIDPATGSSNATQEAKVQLGRKNGPPAGMDNIKLLPTLQALYDMAVKKHGPYHLTTMIHTATPTDSRFRDLGFHKLNHYVAYMVDHGFIKADPNNIEAISLSVAGFIYLLQNGGGRGALKTLPEKEGQAAADLRELFVSKAPAKFHGLIYALFDVPPVDIRFNLPVAASQIEPLFECFLGAAFVHYLQQAVNMDVIAFELVGKGEDGEIRMATKLVKACAAAS